MQLSYKKPASYGDKVIVQTWLEHYDGVRTTYGYNIVNQLNELLVTGATKHVIVHKQSFKPMRLRKVYPEWHEAYEQELKGSL